MNSFKEKTIELAKAIKRSVERFPLTVVFALALTVCAMILEHKGYNGVKNMKKKRVLFPTLFLLFLSI